MIASAVLIAVLWSSSAGAQQPGPEPNFAGPLLPPRPCALDSKDPYEARFYKLEGWAPPDYVRYPGACLGGTVETALEKLTAALATRFAQWRREGFEAVRAEWLAKAGPLGLEVDVRLGEELLRGRFAGMDREGALRRFTSMVPSKLETSTDDLWLDAVLIEAGDDGRATSIEQLLLEDPGR